MGTSLGRNPASVDTSLTPMEPVLVVRQNPETHQRESLNMRWGPVPSWATDPGSPLTHARAETVATKPAFCLVHLIADDLDLLRGQAAAARAGCFRGLAAVFTDNNHAGVILEEDFLEHLQDYH
jgi:hypothetical protein